MGYYYPIEKPGWVNGNVIEDPAPYESCLRPGMGVEPEALLFMAEQLTARRHPAGAIMSAALAQGTWYTGPQKEIDVTNGMMETVPGKTVTIVTSYGVLLFFQTREQYELAHLTYGGPL